MVKGLPLEKIIEQIESVYHPSLKLPFDNPGLHVEASSTIKKILVAFDALLEVIEYAGKKGFDLIVTHHPVQLPDDDSPLTCANVYRKRMISAIRNGVSIYCCHTPIDVSDQGINHRMAELLGVSVSGPLKETENGGIGVVGSLRKPIPLLAFFERVKKVTGAPMIRANQVTGRRRIRTIAYCGGSGGSLLPDAVAAGVDAYVTGDLKIYHGQEARESGLVLVDAGHYYTEKIFVELMFRHLERIREVKVAKYGKVTDGFFFG